MFYTVIKPFGHLKNTSLHERNVKIARLRLGLVILTFLSCFQMSVEFHHKTTNLRLCSDIMTSVLYRLLIGYCRLLSVSKHWILLQLYRTLITNHSKTLSTMDILGHSIRGLLRPVYTTFILGTALLNFGTRANKLGHGTPNSCRVNTFFSVRVPQNLSGPRLPLEVVSARLKKGPRADFARINSSHMRKQNRRDKMASRGRMWSEMATVSLIELWSEETIQYSLSNCKTSRESSEVYKSLQVIISH